MAIRSFVFCLAVILAVILITVSFISRRGQQPIATEGPALVSTKGQAQCKTDASEVSAQRKSYSTADTQSLYGLSKSLVVRRVYFDNRKRQEHKNAIVFVLDIKRGLRSNIFTGCRVGQVKSAKVQFRPSIGLFPIAFVDCFDVGSITEGDPAFLEISHPEFGLLDVKSQKNVIVPQSTKDVSAASYPSVVSCVGTLRLGEIPPSEDGMVYQWLRYQKTIGVDHVHLIAEDTFVTMGGFDHPLIKDALRENYLSIDFWPRWFNTTEIWHSSQHLASTDCVYRFQGVYDYVIIADLDDFFVPHGKSKSIKTYLKKWCSGRQASCNFEWHEFYPDCGWSPESVGPDGNLTANSHNIEKRTNYKSAHQIHALVEVGRHTAMSLLPGYQYISRVPSKQAYFAHLRKGRIPSGGC